MSRSEASAGVQRPTAEQIKQAVDDAMASGYEETIESPPSNYETVDIPLQTFRVSLPKEPILVNQQPYSLAVNQNELVNELFDNSVPPLSPKRYNPTYLGIRLSDSLPADITGKRPRRTNPFHAYDRNTSGFYIDVPRAVTDPEKEDEEIASILRTSLNDDLWSGLRALDIAKESEATRSGLMLTGTTAGIFVGEGIGIWVSSGERISEQLLKGALSGVFGAAVIGLTVGGKAIYNQARFGGKAQMIAGESRDAANRERFDFSPPETARHFFEENPIISLVRVEDSDEQSPKPDSV